MKNTLHITQNDEVVDIGLEEIFNADKYDHFIGVTFSVTANFINRNLSGFRHIELIVGIPEERVRYGANMAAKLIKAKIEGDLNNEPAALYQELTTELKVKINKKHVELFVPIAYVIHSKFYLLSNSETGDNRIILGSANLSEQAFSKTTKQFENVLVFDNHPLYNIYYDHYHQELRPILINYFPQELLDINAKKLNKLEAKDNVNVDEIILLDDKEINQIQEKSVLDTIEKTDEKIRLGILPVKVREEMRNVADDRQQEIRVEREQRRQEDIAYRLVKESISPRAKEPKVKSTPALRRTIRKHIEVKLMDNKETGLPGRPMMVHSIEERNLSKGISGLFIPNSLKSDNLHPLGRYAEEAEIKKALENLDRFIRSFEEYTVKYDDSYGARVMEAILYTFTAPFLSEIKMHARSEEERNDIPQFLLLGGTAGSGKSSLLKVIAKLINHSSIMDYNLIIPTGRQRKKGTVDVIDMWMSETNVAPLLIDEIPEEFFTNKNYGNDLIVNTSNRTAYDLKPSPSFIGTTNTEDYTLEERARRRSYYLRLDKMFDEMHREESQPVYNKIYADLDDGLFNDFVMRMTEKLSDDQLNCAHFGEAGKIDFLYHTREIFKEYYKKVNMPLPRYFPITRYDDSKETNQEKWRKLYLGNSRDEFKFDESTGNLYFKMSVLDENSPIYGNVKPSVIYKNALSPKVVVGSKDGTDMELDTQLFFEWIGISNPFAEHYKNKFRELVSSNDDLLKEARRTGELSIDLEKLIKTDGVRIHERYLEYVPKDLIKNQKGVQVTLDAKKFMEWAGIEQKKSLLERIIKY